MEPAWNGRWTSRKSLVVPERYAAFCLLGGRPLGFLSMSWNAGQILVGGSIFLTLLWWAQLVFRRTQLIRETSGASWALGFLLPLPFFAIPLSVARLGLISDFSRLPPPGFLFLVFMFVLTYAVSRAPIVRAAASALGVSGLVLFQAFRFIPEFAIAAGVRQGIAPSQLGFGGWNFDVYYATLALVLGSLMKWRPDRFANVRFAVTAQALGIASLCVILFIAVTSFPTPLQLFPPSQGNEWVVHEPYVLLPGFMVSAAIMGHFCLHQVLKKQKAG